MLSRAPMRASAVDVSLGKNACIGLDSVDITPYSFLNITTTRTYDTNGEDFISNERGP